MRAPIVECSLSSTWWVQCHLIQWWGSNICDLWNVYHHHPSKAQDEVSTTLLLLCTPFLSAWVLVFLFLLFFVLAKCEFCSCCMLPQTWFISDWVVMHVLYNCGQKGFCSTPISSIDANCNCYHVCNNWVCSVHRTTLLATQLLQTWCFIPEWSCSGWFKDCVEVSKSLSLCSSSVVISGTIQASVFV